MMKADNMIESIRQARAVYEQAVKKERRHEIASQGSQEPMAALTEIRDHVR
ncbi:MAG: hypothetical protein LAQ30_08640 [Acidobacteriia bacterium]|nr:hypothetical protein [Terriglobia bacterium]